MESTTMNSGFFKFGNSKSEKGELGRRRFGSGQRPDRNDLNGRLKDGRQRFGWMVVDCRSYTEASGATGYVLVSAPLVGSFHGQNGERQKPPVYIEGDYLKKEQVIGFLDQFGTQVPVKSNVEGEILKLLFNEGDAVGYGDPIIAIIATISRCQSIFLSFVWSVLRFVALLSQSRNGEGEGTAVEVVNSCDGGAYS